MKTKNYYVCFFLLFIFVALNIHSAYGVDELFLTGVVNRVDNKSKTVVVDVKSESCLGIRSFTVDYSSTLSSNLIGKEISFKIDSSTCKGDTIYKIKSDITKE